MYYVPSHQRITCALSPSYPCVASYDMASVEELSAFDGVVWTGSSLTIHHDTPLVHRHIELARRCYAAAVPQYGSCWGLQISAAAAGLPCEENPRGREQPIARKVELTPEGQVHPMFEGKPQIFDALCAHTDQVATSWVYAPAWPPRCKPGVSAHVLASNEWTTVQALQVRVGDGEFWSTQYHPELELSDVARSCALLQRAKDSWSRELRLTMSCSSTALASRGSMPIPPILTPS